tara:strand:- start:191 stop:847 length:657 start_codon:yes stop_codon:yes gene_type:complete
MSQITSLLLATNTAIQCIPPTIYRPSILLISGTQNAKDLVIDDLDIRKTHWPPKCKSGGKVHRGFARRTTFLLEQIQYFIEVNNGFVLAGHSLGGGCAVLMAAALHEMGKNVNGVYTFGMPHFASHEFKKYYTSSGIVSKHFTTSGDPVVYKIPKVFENVGEYEILNSSKTMLEAHDLRMYDAILCQNERTHLYHILPRLAAMSSLRRFRSTQSTMCM